MPRQEACDDFGDSPMRTAGAQSLDLLLLSGGRNGGELGSMRRLDEQYLQTPFYGSQRMAEMLSVNRKRVQRLMEKMGIEAIYPRHRTTEPSSGHKIYPYLL